MVNFSRTAPASPASQLDTAVTAAECRSTWRNTGRAPTTVRARRTSLEAHARELHVADRIRWHGALPHDALPPFYQRAAALVVPSIDEGLGLVAVEGQICATPVIAANSGGLGDIVRNGQTGVLVPPLDAPALASAIDDILANPDRAHELGAAGRVHALASFAPESAARRYAMLYRSTLEHAKKS